MRDNNITRFKTSVSGQRIAHGLNQLTTREGINLLRLKSIQPIPSHLFRIRLRSIRQTPFPTIQMYSLTALGATFRTSGARESSSK